MLNFSGLENMQPLGQATFNSTVRRHFVKSLFSGLIGEQSLCLTGSQGCARLLPEKQTAQGTAVLLRKCHTGPGHPEP